MPPPWFDPTASDAFQVLQRVKSDEYYEKRMQMWERMYTDPNFLKGISGLTLF